jgi:hypothetical protein
MKLSFFHRVFTHGWLVPRAQRGRGKQSTRFVPHMETMEPRLVPALSTGGFTGVGLGNGNQGGGLPGSGTVGGTTSNAPNLGLNGTQIRIFAVGAVPGHVQVYRTFDRALLLDFMPYGPTYTGPISVAVGDVNGDGFPDLVTGALIGNPQVKVFDGRAIANGTLNPAFPDASLLTPPFFAYGLNFNVGVNVAVGDVLGNGFGDIITGASVGNPHVKIFDGRAIALHSFNSTFPDANLLDQWFAYGLQFNVGVNVAAGDITGDMIAEVVTGATVGNPHVKVYNGTAFANRSFNSTFPDASLLTQFFAYPANIGSGVFVAVGDVQGNHLRDIITGSTVTSQVKVYRGSAISTGTFQSSAPDASLFTQFTAFAGVDTGVTVGASDVQSNGLFDILTGPTRGLAHVRIYPGTASGISPPPLFDLALPNLFTPVYVGG